MIAEKATFNLKEAAAYLGLCENTFKKLIKNNSVPWKRVGRRIIIPKQALDEWLMNAASEKDM